MCCRGVGADPGAIAVGARTMATSKGSPARFMSRRYCLAASTSPKAALQHMQQYRSSWRVSRRTSSTRSAFSNVLYPCMRSPEAYSALPSARSASGSGGGPKSANAAPRRDAATRVARRARPREKRTPRRTSPPRRAAHESSRAADATTRGAATVDRERAGDATSPVMGHATATRATANILPRTRLVGARDAV